MDEVLKTLGLRQVERNQDGFDWLFPSSSLLQDVSQPEGQSSEGSNLNQSQKPPAAPDMQQHRRRNQQAAEHMDVYYNDQVDGDTSIEVVKYLRKEIDNYKESNRQLNAEAVDLRHRLGNCTCNQLKDLSYKTDISDVYASTNLGKKFSEIFDNEWSAAFQEIENRINNEQRSVELLHKIVQNTFESCESKAKDQEERIMEILLDIEENDLHDTDGYGEMNKLHSTLIEVRKNILPRSSVNVGKNYTRGEWLKRLNVHDIKSPGKKLIEFAEKCAELTWCMHMCDPPMSMVVGKVGQPYDTDVYTNYTISGKLKQPIVKYFVWPALRLNVGGQLISKGVARSCEQLGKQK